MHIVNMKTIIAGLEMKNPVMNASGTVDTLSPQNEIAAEALGAYVTKTVTLEPRKGNPPPRTWEISYKTADGNDVAIGMLNSIGLQNPGINSFIKHQLPALQELGIPVIISIGGNNINEYVAISEKLDRTLEKATIPVAVELNVSCPNTEKGMAFGQDHFLSGTLVEQVKKVICLPVIVKLTPNVGDITAVAETVQNSGAAAISAVNTFEAMDVDVDTRRPQLGRGYGGYSGPAILPMALYKVWQISQTVDIPIIGMGGIMTAEDAIKFFLAGASAVAVGTANFHNPQTIPQIVEGIRKYLINRNIADIKDIIGKMKEN